MSFFSELFAQRLQAMTDLAANVSLGTPEPLGTPEITSLDVGWGGYFQAIALLFLLLAIFWVFLYLLKRFGPRAGLGFMGKGVLHLEAQLPMGKGRSIAVVRFLNKRLVVGVTDNQINLLHETDAEDDNAQASFARELKARQSKIVEDASS